MSLSVNTYSLEVDRHSPVAASGTGSPTTFTFFTACCFTLNYIIGTGFLTLPWAFYESGWLAGVLVLGLMTIFSIFASCFILEAMARAQVLLELKGFGENVKSNISGFAYQSLPNVMSIPSPPISGRERHEYDNISPSGGLPLVKDVKFEMTDLCDIFLGRHGRQCYTCMISLYMYGTLWAYSTVFSKALTSHLPIGPYSNICYLILFALLVVPPTLMELNEQVYLQVTLSALRVVMLVIMLLTIAQAAFNPDMDVFSSELDPNTEVAAPAFHLSKLYILVPIAAFANIFHHSVPGLSEPVQDKTQLVKIYSVALMFCFVAYSLIGVTISRYFGSHTMVASNLNWQNYQGIRDVGTNDSSSSSPSLLARGVSFFVVLFPAFDVASAFPLNAITLGNSLFSNYYGNDIALTPGTRIFTKTFFRLISAIPPILAASIDDSLGRITNFTGITGFFLAFIFPALLSIRSQILLKSKGLSSETYYSNLYTKSTFQYCTLALGVFLTGFTLISLVVLGPPTG